MVIATLSAATVTDCTASKSPNSALPRAALMAPLRLRLLRSVMVPPDRGPVGQPYRGGGQGEAWLG